MLLPTLLSHLPSSPYVKSSIPPKQAIDPTLLASGLSNKTVVLIGDRVDQALVEHFCSLAGHIVDRVDARHPWAERLAPGSFSEESPLAHYCYVPEYDFFLTSVYHYGADQSFFFRGKPAWSATSTFEERVEKVIVPYLETTTKSFPASPTLPPPRTTAAARAPALVVLSSSFWDLAKFAQQDIDNLHSLVQDLDEERLLQWRSRHVDMLASLHRSFPKSLLAWRSLHAPASSERATVEWWTGTQKDTDAVSGHSGVWLLETCAIRSRSEIQVHMGSLVSVCLTRRDPWHRCRGQVVGKQGSGSLCMMARCRSWPWSGLLPA